VWGGGAPTVQTREHKMLCCRRKIPLDGAVDSSILQVF
jgi:hypothetical protein